MLMFSCLNMVGAYQPSLGSSPVHKGCEGNGLATAPRSCQVHSLLLLPLPCCLLMQTVNALPVQDLIAVRVSCLVLQTRGGLCDFELCFEASQPIDILSSWLGEMAGT